MKIKKSQLRRIIAEEVAHIREATRSKPWAWELPITDTGDGDSSYPEISDPDVSSMLADALDKFGDAAAVLVEMGIDYEGNSPENLHLMFQKHLDDNARMPTPKILATWLLVRGMSGAYEDLEALLRGSY